MSDHENNYESESDDDEDYESGTDSETKKIVVVVPVIVPVSIIVPVHVPVPIVVPAIVPVPVVELWNLTHNWVLYDHTKSDSDTYEASTRKIAVINSVVKFWRIFNFYPKPSTLFNAGGGKPTMGMKEISSISMFKNNILPKWEDPVNSLGAEVSKRKFSRKDPLEELDSDWLNILMACIGGQIDSSVTGVRVVDSSSQKKNNYTGNIEFKLLYRVELWFDNISKRDIIEEQFKNILGLEDIKGTIHYKEHTIV